MSDVMQNSPRNREELLIFTDELLELIHKNENLYRQILTSESPMYFLRKLRREIAAKIQTIPDLNHNPASWFHMKAEIFADGICEQVVYYFRGRTEYTFEELKTRILTCLQEYF